MPRLVLMSLSRLGLALVDYLHIHSSSAGALANSLGLLRSALDLPR